MAYGSEHGVVGGGTWADSCAEFQFRQESKATWNRALCTFSHRNQGRIRVGMHSSRGLPPHWSHWNDYHVRRSRRYVARGAPSRGGCSRSLIRHRKHFPYLHAHKYTQIPQEAKRKNVYHARLDAIRENFQVMLKIVSRISS